MALRITSTKLNNQKNKLDLKFIIPGNKTLVTNTIPGKNDIHKTETINSKEYKINNVIFQFRINMSQTTNSFSNDTLLLIFVRFIETNGARYSYKISSKALKKQNYEFVCGVIQWRLLHEVQHLNPLMIDISLQIEHLCEPTTFKSLHDDTILTDFELHGQDGVVKIHSTAIAAISAPLRRMLEGKWSETSSRSIKFPDLTLKTLQQLKDYIYLGILPEDGLKELLLLAHQYDIEGLENECVDLLIRKLNEENALEISTFAIETKMMKLYAAFLKRVQDKAIDLNKVRLE